MKVFARKETFYDLIQLAAKVNTETIGKETDEAKKFAHIFFSKNLITSITILNIINPKPIKIGVLGNEYSQVYDPSSAFVLLRNLFETFVNMHHLLIDNRDDSELKLKLLLWNRHFRAERKKMADLRCIHHPKIDQELKEIEIINQGIKLNGYFKKLSEKEQKKILRIDFWSEYTKTMRAERSYINEKRAQFMYKYLSNYSHSESFAIMQYSSINNPKEAIEQLESIIVHYSEGLLSLTIKAFFVYYEKYVNSNDRKELDLYVQFYQDLWKKVR